MGGVGQGVCRKGGEELDQKRYVTALGSGTLGERREQQIFLMFSGVM